MKKNTKIKIILNILSILLVASGIIINSSWSTIGIMVEKDSLASEADLILVGTVKEKKSEEIGEEGGVYTYITLSVDDLIKGFPVNEVTVKQFGGDIGNRGLVIPGMPKFSQGERVLVFLKYFAEDGYYRVVEAAQGKFSVVKEHESGRDMLKRDLSALHFINKRPKDGKVYLDDFIKSLR